MKSGRDTQSNLKIAHREMLHVYAHLPVSDSGMAGWPAGCLADELSPAAFLLSCCLPL